MRSPLIGLAGGGWGGRDLRFRPAATGGRASRLVGVVAGQATYGSCYRPVRAYRRPVSDRRVPRGSR